MTRFGEISPLCQNLKNLFGKIFCQSGVLSLLKMAKCRKTNLAIWSRCSLEVFSSQLGIPFSHKCNNVALQSHVVKLDGVFSTSPIIIHTCHSQNLDSILNFYFCLRQKAEPALGITRVVVFLKAFPPLFLLFLSFPLYLVFFIEALIIYTTN